MKAQVIYKIINLVNAKFYVGSTVNQRERFRCHRSRLRRNKHHCAHLQAAWNQYGEDNFLFKVVETVPDGKSLQAAEDVWLAEHVGKEYCYNHSKFSDAPMRGRLGEDNPNFGRIVPMEQRKVTSEALKAYYAEFPENHPRLGAIVTEETRQKLSTSNKGKTAGDKHYRYGATLSEEVKRKIGDTQRGVPKGPGRKVSPEGMEKIRAAAAAGSYDHWLGRTHTEESKLKMSKAVEATNPLGDVKTYPSITAIRETLQLKPATINRSLKSGKPISKGKYSGWSFKYA